MFTVRLAFTEEVFNGNESFDKNQAIQDALQVSGGTVSGRRRVERGSFDRWIFRIRPSGNGAVTLTLPETTGACSATGAICTPGGTALSNAPTVTVPGPASVPEISVAAGSSTKSEGGSPSFTLTRTGSLTGALTMNVDVSENGAMLKGTPADTVTFGASSATADLSVATEDDEVVESASVITASISAGSGYSIDSSAAQDTVTVADDDAAPVITSTGPFAAAENGTAIATLTATDQDTAASGLSWSVTGGADQDKFTLSSAGVLAFAAAKDFEAPDDADGDGDYEVTVRVTDGANPVEATLTVSLTNVDETVTPFGGGVHSIAYIAQASSGQPPSLRNAPRVPELPSGRGLAAPRTMQQAGFGIVMKTLLLQSLDAAMALPEIAGRGPVGRAPGRRFRFLSLTERKRMTSTCDCRADSIGPFRLCTRIFRNATAARIAAALLVFLAHATLSPAHALDGFTVGTASVGSTPHILGTAMQQVFSEKFPEGRFEVAVTGGSIENSRMMRRGEAELGIASVTGSAMRNAWHGRNLEAGEEPYKEIRTLMGFVHIVGHLIARPGAGIENFEDIKGKRVGLGSSIRTSALHEPFWRSQGVDWIDDVEEVPLGSQDRYRFLAEGRVDAALAWTVGTKLAAIIEEYASANEAVWAKTDKAALEEAGFTVFAFEPGSLPGLDFVNHGPSLTMSALTTTDEFPDEAAYEIVKTLHENMEQIVLLLPAVQAAIENPAIFTSPSDPFPYHPGAIRYWKEVGLWDSE